MDDGCTAVEDGLSVVVHEWMWSGDGLALAPGPELMVYALVYQVTAHGLGGLYASNSALAASLGLRRETVNRALRRLGDEGLVYVCGRAQGSHGGIPVKVWATCQPPVDRAVRGLRPRAAAQLDGAPEGVFDSGGRPGAAEGGVFDSGGAPNVTGSHIGPSQCDRESHSQCDRDANVIEGHIGKHPATTGETALFDNASPSPSPSVRNNKDKDGDVPRPLTGEEGRAFALLWSMNRRKPKPGFEASDRGEALDAWREALGRRLTPDVLLAAYRSYSGWLDDLRARTGRFPVKSLASWLHEGADNKFVAAACDDAADRRAREAVEVRRHGRPVVTLGRTAEGDWVWSAPGHAVSYVAQGGGRGMTREQAMEAVRREAGTGVIFEDEEVEE